MTTDRAQLVGTALAALWLVVLAVVDLGLSADFAQITGRRLGEGAPGGS